MSKYKSCSPPGSRPAQYALPPRCMAASPPAALCIRRVRPCRLTTSIKWQDKISNTEVPLRCEISDIDAFITRAQLRPHTQKPKAFFYSELQSRSPPHGHLRQRYKDKLNAKISNGVNSRTWERLYSNWTKWPEARITAVQRVYSVVPPCRQRNR